MELRKSFDTRSGMWLLASIAIAALATTGAILAWGPREQFTYSEFLLAIGMPMTLLLPIIAALSVTAEWTQRTGLATFTLVPHRGRVLLAKAVASVLVAAGATVVTSVVALVGTLTGAKVAGITPVWDCDATALAAFAPVRSIVVGCEGGTDFLSLLEHAPSSTAITVTTATDARAPRLIATRRT